MPGFRIIDVRPGTVVPEISLEAESPERAAELALGVRVFRGGTKNNLVCRVYWQSRNGLNMVRLYSENNAAR